MRALQILAGLMLATTVVAQPVPAGGRLPGPETIPVPPRFVLGPRELGARYLSEGTFEKLEALVNELVTTKTRNMDGRPELYMLEQGLQEFFDEPHSTGNTYVHSKLQAWQREFPTSAYRPIVVAIEQNVAAWRARGNGFSSTVTEEGWKLFHERSLKAWNTLIDSKQGSSRIPSWYSNAISVGLNANISDSELRGLFEEGIARHPGYLPIYFDYMRNFAPRWGGTFESADKFILEQVAAKTNVDGEELYTRLYWMLDQYNGQQPSLFEESLVSWPRMRKGFEQMMRELPHSEWNIANFASYACRAHDATSYGKLRPMIQAPQFENAAPEGISLDVCDARFMKRT